MAPHSESNMEQSNTEQSNTELFNIEQSIRIPEFLNTLPDDFFTEQPNIEQSTMEYFSMLPDDFFARFTPEEQSTMEHLSMLPLPREFFAGIFPTEQYNTEQSNTEQSNTEQSTMEHFSMLPDDDFFTGVLPTEQSDTEQSTTEQSDTEQSDTEQINTKQSTMVDLSMTRDDFLTEINRDRDDDNKYDTVTVGAAILQDGKKVLLLQRRHDRLHFPRFYELPAGRAQYYDATLKKALISGVRRWAGLRFDRVVRPLPAFAYRTNNAVSGAENAFQLNYLVQVKEGDVPRIQWQEHLDKCWADKNKLDELEIIEEMKGVVMEALKSA